MNRINCLQSKMYVPFHWNQYLKPSSFQLINTIYNMILLEVSTLGDSEHRFREFYVFSLLSDQLPMSGIIIREAKHMLLKFNPSFANVTGNSRLNRFQVANQSLIKIISGCLPWHYQKKCGIGCFLWNTTQEDGDRVRSVFYWTWLE